VSRESGSRVFVGNDFIVPRPRMQMAMPTPAPQPVVAAPVISIPVQATESLGSIAVHGSRSRRNLWQDFLELIHRYSLGTFALLFLLVSTTGLQVGQGYWAAHVINDTKIATPQQPVRTVAGLNAVVPANQFAERLSIITNQPATILVGTETVKISPDVIKSWLLVTPSTDGSAKYIRVKAGAMQDSLLAIANKYTKAPVNQVTATYADGTSKVIATGKNGVALSDPEGLKRQASAAAKNVMDAKGLNFTAPLSVQAFASVTPAAYDKLIEVNVVSKQMYLYEKGNLVRTYPISAGAPETPTPLGQYKIFSKLPVQNMSGYNPNGTKYFQPNVRWISYFETGGYAVHGNYWRPASYFGRINSSHGCVSLPDVDAKWVYEWSPIGTTVITHS
jgi:lipoprotein-anchoring transpeptidase ErfK/SrfK